MTKFTEDWSRQSETKSKNCILTVLSADNSVETQLLLCGVVPCENERLLKFEKASVKVPKTEIIEKSWGQIRELYRSDLLVVQVVEINPGRRTPLEKHFHCRERYWLLSGEGYAEWDGESSVLRKDREYITAPESIHCVENRGSTPLTFLCVQTGDCLRDDVVYYDDLESEVSIEHICDTCNSTWEVAKHLKEPRILRLIASQVCPHCGVHGLVSQSVRVPPNNPEPMDHGGNLWCRDCGYKVHDDEGPCPVCESDLEISVTTEPQTPKVQPLPANVFLGEPGPLRDETEHSIVAVTNPAIYSRLWKNWPVHNMIAHPVSELLHWIWLGSLGNRIHDATVPPHVAGTGRG